jgi:hypothetical protein
VAALVRAVAEPEFGLHGCTASTGGSAPFVVVNGPIRTRLAMHATHNALGNGARANATIGRALRLIVLNVLGGVPGQLDRSTFGHPGKFTFCVAEDEEGSPWPPLAADRGTSGRRTRARSSRRTPPRSARTCSRTRSGRATTRS